MSNQDSSFSHFAEEPQKETHTESLHSSAPVAQPGIFSVDALLKTTKEGKHMPKKQSENILRKMYADVAVASESFSRLEGYRSNMGKLIRDVESGMLKNFGMSNDALHESAIRYQILDDTDLF